jgi:hypothetical protein
MHKKCTQPPKSAQNDPKSAQNDPKSAQKTEPPIEENTAE